jgi:TPR repeat protein
MKLGALAYADALESRNAGDFERAARLFERALQNPNKPPDADIDEAETALVFLYLYLWPDDSQQTRGIRLLQGMHARDPNNRFALERLGYHYENGLGVPQNFERAAANYRRLIDTKPKYGQATAEEAFRLARLIHEGKVVPKPDESVSGLIESIGHGAPTFPGALVAERYRLGDMVPRDVERARTLLKGAVDDNDDRLSAVVLDLWDSEPPPPTPAKAEDALNGWQERARSGDADAMFRTGLAYAIGRGTRWDQAAAYRWLREAGKNGHAIAQYLLGYFGIAIATLEPNEVGPDEGIRWMEAAASTGHLPAQRLLGFAYNWGPFPFYRDTYAALQWYDLAARSGDAEATMDAAKLSAWLFSCFGRDPDFDNALAYAREGALLGSAEGGPYAAELLSEYDKRKEEGVRHRRLLRYYDRNDETPLEGMTIHTTYSFLGQTRSTTRPHDCPTEKRTRPIPPFSRDRTDSSRASRGE